MFELIPKPVIDGMSVEKAWTYHGGWGGAGFHLEDGYTGFRNAAHGLSFELITQPGQEYFVELWEVRVLQAMLRLSVKTWVFYKGEMEGMLPTAAIIAAINEWLAVQFGVSSCTTADGLARARQYVLDPWVLADKFPEMFYVVHQWPGLVLESMLGHSVSGISWFSQAWNVCGLTTLSGCMALERAVSRLTRMKRRTTKKHKHQSDEGTPAFCLASYIFQAYTFAHGAQTRVMELLKAVSSEAFGSCGS